MEKNKVPSVIETYAETGDVVDVKYNDELVEYEVSKGEVVLVSYWCRFPSYDFLFGVPHKDSPKYEKEFGYFQFRKKREDGSQTGWSIYCDQIELEEMISGFLRILSVSKQERQKEWEEFSKKNFRFQPESE